MVKRRIKPAFHQAPASLVAVDFELMQLMPAAFDFGLIFKTVWLQTLSESGLFGGAAYASYERRKQTLRAYVERIGMVDWKEVMNTD